VLRGFARTCLLLFVSEGPAHGYELVERLEQLGINASDPGTVYRSLHCLEEQGLLRSRWEPSEHGGPARRVYDITGRGIQALHADADALRRDERTLTAFLAHYESLYQRPPVTERAWRPPGAPRRVAEQPSLDA
jgi:PadR family transcriptional regulator, regulatory protein PadR